MEIFWGLKQGELVAHLQGEQELLARWDVSGVEPSHAKSLADLLAVHPELGWQLVAGFQGMRLEQVRGQGVSADRAADRAFVLRIEPRARPGSRPLRASIVPSRSLG